MSILKKMQENTTVVNENEQVEEKVEKSSSVEEEIKKKFMERAEEFWGEISKLTVVLHRESHNGVPYYFVICENSRGDSKGKLIQEWYINNKGEPRINPKRTMWINIALADEVANILFE